MKMRCGKTAIALMIIIGFMSSAFAFFPRRDTNIHIPKTAQWGYTPSIRVCKISPLSVGEVAIALQWWKDLGYEFDFVYSDHCQNLIKYGTITITLDQGQLFMNNLLGRTTFYADSETGSIAWTIIELRSPYTDRVLEHEIGHALGWMHARVRGHMMHPNHFDGGWSPRGLGAEEVAND